MCRFTAYLGRPIRLDELLLRPDHSIIRQSFGAREGREPMNGDGFGVGWYVPELDPEPALYRNVRPAWADTNMAHIAPRTRTNLFFAHVRGATPGIPIHQLNCHPFVAGRLMFMHNGTIGAHGEVNKILRDDLEDDLYFSIQGSTDSEHLFAAIRQAMGRSALEPTAEDMADGILDALAHVEEVRMEHAPEEPTVANLALTDGRSMVVCRYATPGKDPATLYLGRAKSFTCEDGVCVAHSPGEPGSVLISSEALWEEHTAWEPVPKNSLLVVEPDFSVHHRSIPDASA